MRFLSALPLLAFLPAALPIRADDVRPIRFGPYLQQSVTLAGNPVGWRYVPPNGSYGFQAGWIEPIGPPTDGLFRGTYLEAEASATASPFESDAGTGFNLKPLRFLEGGIKYNRVLFPNTLVGFNPPDGAPNNWLPNVDQWRAFDILEAGLRETAGADVFTFHGSATVDLGRLQLHAGGFRSLWDVDVQDQEIIFEYNSNLLIRKRDRLSSLYGQAFLDLEPYLHAGPFTLRGFTVRDQYWSTTETGQQQNLASVGFTDLRLGHNTGRRYRGLDGFVGFWTDHPQLDNLGGWEHLRLNFEWVWNVQILHLTDD